tara:strand:+ start:2397 stop:2627 length:231 start_codon:yes stop_codon:yes gene_type:complete
MKNLFEGLTEESRNSINEMIIDYPTSAELVIRDLKSNDIIGNLKFDTLRTMIMHFTETGTFAMGFDVYSFFKEEIV